MDFSELGGAPKIVSVTFRRLAALRSLRPVTSSLNLTSPVLPAGIEKLARATVSVLVLAVLALLLLDSLTLKNSEP